MRIAASGHRALRPEVSALIDRAARTELERLGGTGPDLIGLSCLADGADQIFAAAILDRGGSLEVIVPAETYRDGLPDQSKPLYDKLLDQADAVHRRDHRESNADAHMDASTFMVDRADRLFAVWDGQPARGYGGTADVVAYARERGVPVTVIWPDGAHRD
jgi:hypothetical protein